MRYRIKIIEKRNGTKIFIPQAQEKITGFSFLIHLLGIICVQKRYIKYRGLLKVEGFSPGHISQLFNIKVGDIITCSDDEATKFSDYDSAMALLQEFMEQEKRLDNSTKEKAISSKIAKAAQMDRINGEKIRKVTCIRVK